MAAVPALGTGRREETNAFFHQTRGITAFPETDLGERNSLDPMTGRRRFAKNWHTAGERGTRTRPPQLRGYPEKAARKCRRTIGIVPHYLIVPEEGIREVKGKLLTRRGWLSRRKMARREGVIRGTALGCASTSSAGGSRG